MEKRVRICFSAYAGWREMDLETRDCGCYCGDGDGREGDYWMTFCETPGGQQYPPAGRVCEVGRRWIPDDQGWGSRRRLSPRAWLTGW